MKTLLIILLAGSNLAISTGLTSEKPCGTTVNFDLDKRVRWISTMGPTEECKFTLNPPKKENAIVYFYCKSCSLTSSPCTRPNVVIYFTGPLSDPLEVNFPSQKKTTKIFCHVRIDHIRPPPGTRPPPSTKPPSGSRPPPGTRPPPSKEEMRRGTERAEREVVAKPCGSIINLDEKEMPAIEFTSNGMVEGFCNFTINAPNGTFVNVACDNGYGIARGSGPAPLKTGFAPPKEKQLSCLAGIVEEPKEPEASQDENDVDSMIQVSHAAPKCIFTWCDFCPLCARAFHAHKKDEAYQASVLAQNEERIKILNADPSHTWTTGVTSKSDKRKANWQCCIRVSGLVVCGSSLC